MKTLFNNKYRVKSSRMKGWDYSNSDAYFITICTKNRIHFFGDINNGIMCLNEIGGLVYNDWLNIPNRNPNIQLGEFIVMPNHIHGLLILNNDVETFRETSLRTNHSMSKISPKPNSISRIVRSYKSGIKNHLNKQKTEFAWQTRFHEHIIRNSQSFSRISNYIRTNPNTWSTDKFY